MKKEEMTARIEAFHKLPDWIITEDEIAQVLLSDMNKLRYDLLQTVYVGKKYKINDKVFHIVNTLDNSFNLVVRTVNTCTKEWFYSHVPYYEIDVKELYK